MKLTPELIKKVQARWKGDPSFLGFPDAERDTAESDWFDHLLVQPNWFVPALQKKTTLIVGRKGVGKTAARIAATRQLQKNDKTIVVDVSADELVSPHSESLQKAVEHGFGSIAEWRQVFADAIVRKIARDLTGKVITKDDDQIIRKWATMEGVSERDFGERIASAMSSVVPWARKILRENSDAKMTDARIQRIVEARSFALYVDDFDNIQERRSIATLRVIRDAVEAADRITHQNNTASVHLLMRQDLWLRIWPGWHYADKVAGLSMLTWSQDDLGKWADRRLRHAAAVALKCDPRSLEGGSGDFWAIFFPGDIKLRNEKESTGIHYLVRRTMYTPRGLHRFMSLIVRNAKRLPADLRDVEDAEEEFSSDQLEFLKTEFSGLCEGLGICLQSFTGKPLEMRATDLYKHLKGLQGTGQVRLASGASDGDDAIALAHFLFRIGFLEVRYPEEGRYEVRDAMRHPDHWKAIRKDDAVRWAVRSAFYCALRSHNNPLS